MSAHPRMMQVRATAMTVYRASAAMRGAAGSRADRRVRRAGRMRSLMMSVWRGMSMAGRLYMRVRSGGSLSHRGM